MGNKLSFLANYKLILLFYKIIKCLDHIFNYYNFFQNKFETQLWKLYSFDQKMLNLLFDTSLVERNPILQNKLNGNMI